MERPLIIIADDNSDYTFLMDKVLRSIKPQAEWIFVDNGESLLSTIKEQEKAPRIIIADISMPKINGLQALREIKKDKTAENSMVVIFTVSETELDMELAFELDCNGYYVKGSTFQEIQDALIDILAAAHVNTMSEIN